MEDIYKHLLFTVCMHACSSKNKSVFIFPYREEGYTYSLMMDCVFNPTLISPYTKEKVTSPPKGWIPIKEWIKYCLRKPLYGGYMKDYTHNPPTGRILTHISFSQCMDATKTVKLPPSKPLPLIRSLKISTGGSLVLYNCYQSIKFCKMLVEMG